MAWRKSSVEFPPVATRGADETDDTRVTDWRPTLTYGRTAYLSRQSVGVRLDAFVLGMDLEGFKCRLGGILLLLKLNPLRLKLTHRTYDCFHRPRLDGLLNCNG